MQRIKRRIFSGVVCEQEVYTYERTRQDRSSEPRLRFKTEEERLQHKLNISRRKHARLVNENFSPSSLYSTLTFNQENECHDYTECKILRDRYFRRLKRKYPDAVIFIYIGRGKNTNRFHVHMLSEGIPEEYVLKQWTYGDVNRVVHLREHNTYEGVDRGQDYTALANYLFEHWEPEAGPHRWKATRNAKQPQKEEPTVCKRTYNEKNVPVAPKGYVLVEIQATKYGYFYYKYVLDPKLQHGSRKKKRM
ncbi:MAG: hypothetical protein MJ086_03485 [Lachnospiraceae bacterium]|nr:hypothetical protein [Lachnospiraceae bacterium]